MGQDEVAILTAVIERTAAFRARSDRWRAMRQSVANALNVFLLAPPPLRHIFKDRGGYILTNAVLYACIIDPDQATLANLKTMLIEAGVASRGRSAALLTFMIDKGLLRTSDASPHLLEPGRPLLSYHLETLRNGCGSVRSLGGVAPHPADLGVSTLADYIRQSAVFAQPAFRDVIVEPPGVRLVSEYNGGLYLLYALLAAIPGDEPTATGFISISRLASDIGVSRAHVRKMLAGVATEGLIDWDRDSGAVSLSPAMIFQIELFLCGTLAILENCFTRLGLSADPERAVANSQDNRPVPC